MLILSTQFYKFNETTYTEQGTVQLVDVQEKKSRPIQLSETWRFIPNIHIAPEAFNDEEATLIEMPHIMKGMEKGTYAIRIQVPHANAIYSFKFNTYADELDIWVNNERAGQVNMPRLTDAITFYAKEKDIHLVIHSTSTSANLSVVETPMFGTLEQISIIKKREDTFSFFISTTFFILGIYSLLIYFNRNQDTFFLNGGLCILLAGISTLLVGEKVILDIFPSLPDDVRLKIKSFVILASAIPIVALLHNLKFFTVKKRTAYLFTALIVFVILISVFFPSNLYLHFEDYFLSVILLVLISISIALFASIYIKKNQSNELFYAFLAFSHCTTYMLLQIYKDLFGFDMFVDIWLFLFISYIFAFLVVRTKNSQKEIEQIKYDAVQSKISFLTVQIKPHFIHNSIANIIALCYTEPRKAAQILGRFSTYLRLIFENNGPNLYIPLQKELMLIDAYVEIEQARFPEKINFSREIDPKLVFTSVPALAIQPFVENAIRHGLFHQTEGGHVHLAVRQVGDYIHITIQDDGIGIAPEKLQAILQLNDADSGIGIQNVIQRLNYMKHGDITIQSELNKGTLVTIKCPLIDTKLED